MTDPKTLRRLKECGYRYLILDSVILEDTEDVNKEGTAYWEVIPSKNLPTTLPEATECIALDAEIINSTIGSDCCVFVVSEEYLVQKLTYGMPIL